MEPITQRQFIEETPEIIEAHKKSIAKWLNKGRKLTALTALYEWGCFRLSARVYDLRREGMDIKTEIIEITSASVRANKKRVAQYSIKK